MEENNSSHPQTKEVLTPLAGMLIDRFERAEEANHEQKISVNVVVSKVASWYEKLRNAMEYREEEVVLRAAIERNLRRHLLLGGNAQTTAEPLVRELIWAGYLKDEEVPESFIEKVEHAIDTYLAFRLGVLQKHRFPQAVLDEWVYHLMSSEVERIVNPQPEKETMSNFMFQIMKEHIQIVDDSEETKDAQVYIAVRRAFARDDVAFLRYHLFRLYFGEMNKETVEHIIDQFPHGYKEIERELKYPRKEKIYAYVKKRAASFLILEDVLKKNKGDDRNLVTDPERLAREVDYAAEERYQSISVKVRRAIVRSIAFILLTKVLFAFLIEGTYERIVYGEILWGSIIINTSVPPLLMVIVSLFIRTPGKDNTKRMLTMIQAMLFDESPRLGSPLKMSKEKSKKLSLSNTVFTILWLLAFVISFGGISFVLSKLNFNIVSQFIFLFFLAIVSFLAYRISLAANLYKVGDKQGYITPVVDFLFMPVVRVGRHLAQGISQVNFLLFIFDFIIETPFKLIFAFSERWFRFLQEKREEMG